MTKESASAKMIECRKNIDRIDVQIVALLNERTRIVKLIGQIKSEFSMPVYEPKREDEVFRNVLEHNNGPLPADAVRRIFERLIDEMRTIQQPKRES
ncbi:MAG TPA: chorismate mutase [Bryobacteraceae bacterium]|nr:chorismate mutase [Bryobacteraceae bacterium]